MSTPSPVNAENGIASGVASDQCLTLIRRDAVDLVQHRDDVRFQRSSESTLPPRGAAVGQVSRR